VPPAVECDVPSARPSPEALEDGDARGEPVSDVERAPELEAGEDLPVEAEDRDEPVGRPPAEADDGGGDVRRERVEDLLGGPGGEGPPAF